MQLEVAERRAKEVEKALEKEREERERERKDRLGGATKEWERRAGVAENALKERESGVREARRERGALEEEVGEGEGGVGCL